MRYTRYLKKAVKLFRKKGIMPEYITFFVTNRCNARCGHCFYWKELNSRSNELTLAEIERASKTMGDFLYLLVTGGEPFLREDLAEIVKIFYKNNNVRKFTLVTNGSLPEKIEGSLKRLMSGCPEAYVTLFVSLDGIGEEHDAIRGVKGLYAKALESIKRARLLQALYPNLSIGVTMIYSSGNKDRIIDIYERIKSDVRPDIVNCNFVRGTVKDEGTKTNDMGNFIKLQKAIEGDLIMRRIKGVSDPIIADLTAACKFESMAQLVRTVEEDRYLSPCYAARINAVIYPEGDVFPCELLDEKMGNLRESGYDFRRIWFSGRAEEVRRKIDKSRCYCTHECYLLTNVMFNPGYLLRILRSYFRLFSRV